MPDSDAEWPRLFGLAAEEGRHVQVVGRNILADFADVLLDLVDDVWQSLLDGHVWNFAASFPGLRQEGLLLVNVFLVGVLEARGNDSDLHGVLHVVILHGAENNVGILVRGLLNDAGRFVNFVQREARAAGNVDEDALSALDGIVFQKRAGNSAVRASTARFVPVATAVPITA